MNKIFNDRENAIQEMAQPVSDPERRKILLAATSVAGGTALAAASIPFIISMNPSERARAAGAPLTVDFSHLAPGMQTTVEWRGKPVWILRRTDAMLKSLQVPRHQAKLADPESDVKSQQPAYAQNTNRSVKPEHLIVVSLCTHLGCIPTFRPGVADKDLGADWDGGYFCPCHGSKFDFSGRVYRNVPAPTNLVIPPHHYLSETTVTIGEDPGSSKA